jgi:hypothetical protein
MSHKQIARWSQKFFAIHRDATAEEFMQWCYPLIAKDGYRRYDRGLVVDYEPPKSGLKGRLKTPSIGYLPLSTFDWGVWSDTLPPTETAWLVTALFTYDPKQEYVIARFRPEGVRFGRFADHGEARPPRGIKLKWLMCSHRAGCGLMTT